MKTILIAEDNDLNFGLFCRILEDMDITILHACNGKEAVEICRDTPDISLILMDIQMPEMNGEDAAVLIRKFNLDVPIISQTAYDVTGMVSEGNKWCFSEFITKPLNISYLKELVCKYCSIEK